MADSVDKAFESLGILRRCLCRIHRFGPGTPGKAMRKDMGECIQMGHWSLILSGVVEKTSIKPEHLHTVCRIGRPDVVEALVTQYDQNPYARLAGGWSALHTAVTHNQTETVQTLMNLGVTDVPTDDGVLAFGIRPDFDDPEDDATKMRKMRQLLTLGETEEAAKRKLVTFDYQLSPMSSYRNGLWRRNWSNLDITAYEALMHLIHFYQRSQRRTGNDLVSLQLLCDTICSVMDQIGASEVWSMMKNGHTIWKTAVQANCRTLCHLLAEKLGGFQEVVASFEIIFSNSLRWACKHNRVDMVRFLLEHGVNPTWQKNARLTPALFTACAAEDLECIRLLLEHGANPNEDNETIASELLRQACYVGNPEIVQLLLEHGAYVSGSSYERQRAYQTPLHIACMWGNVASTRLLLDHGAVVDALDRTNETPLFYACRLSDPTCARLLLSKGADTTVFNHPNRWTPMHVACKKGLTRTISLLLDHGAEVDTTDVNGDVPLIFACEIKNSECAQTLLERGANADATNLFGETPLRKAYEAKDMECVRLLLAHGAEREKQTLYNEARENGNNEFARLIESTELDEPSAKRARNV